MSELLFFVVSFLASIAGAICGIGGGMVGRIFNKKMDNKAVDKLFLCLMGIIIAISIYNTIKYLG